MAGSTSFSLCMCTVSVAVAAVVFALLVASTASQGTPEDKATFNWIPHSFDNDTFLVTYGLPQARQPVCADGSSTDGDAESVCQRLLGGPANAAAALPLSILPEVNQSSMINVLCDGSQCYTVPNPQCTQALVLRCVDYLGHDRHLLDFQADIGSGLAIGTPRTEVIHVPEQGIKVNCFVVHDFNGDGVVDTVAVSKRKDLVLTMSNKRGPREVMYLLSGANDLTTVQIGDFNRDGLADIVASHNAVRLQWWPNLGGGQFQANTSFIMEDVPVGQHDVSRMVYMPGDVQTHRPAILAVASFSARDIHVYVDAHLDFQWTSVDSLKLDSRHVLDISVADMSGDGLPDIVVIERDAVSFFEAISSIEFRAKITLYDSGSVAAATVADIDGNGLLDTIIASRIVPEVTAIVVCRRFKNDALPCVPIRMVPNEPQPVDGVLVADADGDGTPEILIHQGSTLLALTHLTFTEQDQMNAAFWLVILGLSSSEAGFAMFDSTAPNHGLVPTRIPVAPDFVGQGELLFPPDSLVVVQNPHQEGMKKQKILSPPLPPGGDMVGAVIRNRHRDNELRRAHGFPVVAVTSQTGLHVFNLASDTHELVYASQAPVYSPFVVELGVQAAIVFIDPLVGLVALYDLSESPAVILPMPGILSAAAIDINGDGVPGLYVHMSDHSLRLHEHDMFEASEASSLEWSTIKWPLRPKNVIDASMAGIISKMIPADVDNDGDQDLFLAGEQQTLLLLETTDGYSGTCVLRTVGSLVDKASDMAAIDVDEDGDMDVMVMLKEQDKIMLFENTDGQGTFVYVKVGDVYQPASIALGRFQTLTTESGDTTEQGQHLVQLATATAFGPLVTSMFVGSTFIGTPVLISASVPFPQAMVPIDVDEDGDIDFVTLSAYGSLFVHSNGMTHKADPSAIDPFCVYRTGYEQVGDKNASSLACRQCRPGHTRIPASASSSYRTAAQTTCRRCSDTPIRNCRRAVCDTYTLTCQGCQEGYKLTPSGICVLEFRPFTVMSSSLASLTARASTIAAADLNGDSVEDIVLVEDATLRLLLSNVSLAQSRTDPQSSIYEHVELYSDPSGRQPMFSIADVDQNGRPDILYYVFDSRLVHVASVSPSSPASVISARPLGMVPEVSGLVTCHVDDDELLDIVLTVSHGSLVWMKQRDDGTFEQFEILQQGVVLNDLVVADTNRDNLTDVVAVASKGLVLLSNIPGGPLLGQQDQLCTTSSPIVGVASTVIHAHDHVNMAILESSGNIIICSLYYDETRRRYSSKALTVGSVLAGTGIALSDIDLDGDLDIIVSVGPDVSAKMGAFAWFEAKSTSEAATIEALLESFQSEPRWFGSAAARASMSTIVITHETSLDRAQPVPWTAAASQLPSHATQRQAILSSDAKGNVILDVFLDDVDLAPPSVSCPHSVAYVTMPGSAYARAPLGIRATDNHVVEGYSAVVSLIESPAKLASNKTTFSGSGTGEQEFVLLPHGRSSVIATVTDDAGNNASCIMESTVRDREQPVVQQCKSSHVAIVSDTSPPDATASLEDVRFDLEPLIVATDNVGVERIRAFDASTKVHSDDQDLMSIGFAPGYSSVVSIAQDYDGNTASCNTHLVVAPIRPHIVTLGSETMLEMQSRQQLDMMASFDQTMSGGTALSGADQVLFEQGQGDSGATVSITINQGTRIELGIFPSDIEASLLGMASFVVTSGTLPAGLSLTRNIGRLQGVPLEAVTGRAFTVSVISDQTSLVHSSVSFNMTIRPFFVRWPIARFEATPTPTGETMFAPGHSSSVRGGMGCVTYSARIVSTGKQSERSRRAAMSELAPGFLFQPVGTFTITNTSLRGEVELEILAMDSSGLITPVEFQNGQTRLMVVLHDCDAAASCNGGKCVDTVPFDGEFACDCSDTDKTGAFCDQVASLPSSSSTDMTVVGPIVGVALIMVLLLLLVVAAVVRKSRHIQRQQRHELEELKQRAKARFEGRGHAFSEDMDRKFQEKEIASHLVVCEQELGQGEFGVVYRGILYSDTVNPGRSSRGRLSQLSEQMGQDVAIKQTKPGASDEQLEEFLMEARLMCALNHENIVSLIGVHSEDKPFMICMEFMPGGDLRSYLRASRPDLETPLEIISADDLVGAATKICSALVYLHSIGIVHRDLAARNVLVGESIHTVKLADFGLSKSLEESDYYRKTTNEKVPIKWLAPESIRDKTYDEKTDVWSFGVLWWEMFTFGEQPYPRYTAVETIMAVATGTRLERPEICSLSMYDKMLETWKQDPASRPTFSLLHDFLKEQVRRRDTLRRRAGPSKKGSFATVTSGQYGSDATAPAEGASNHYLKLLEEEEEAEASSKEAGNGNIAPNCDQSDSASAYVQLLDAPAECSQATVQAKADVDDLSESSSAPSARPGELRPPLLVTRQGTFVADDSGQAARDGRSENAYLRLLDAAEAAKLSGNAFGNTASTTADANSSASSTGHCSDNQRHSTAHASSSAASTASASSSSASSTAQARSETRTAMTSTVAPAVGGIHSASSARGGDYSTVAQCDRQRSPVRQCNTSQTNRGGNEHYATISADVLSQYHHISEAVARRLLSDSARSSRRDSVASSSGTRNEPATQNYEQLPEVRRDDSPLGMVQALINLAAGPSVPRPGQPRPAEPVPNKSPEKVAHIAIDVGDGDGGELDDEPQSDGEGESQAETSFV